MCGVYIVDCEELSNLRNTKFSSGMNNFNIIFWNWIIGDLADFLVEFL